MAELADARDLESRPQGCRFKSCCQHQVIVIRTKYLLRASGSDLLLLYGTMQIDYMADICYNL